MGHSSKQRLMAAAALSAFSALTPSGASAAAQTAGNSTVGPPLAGAASSPQGNADQPVTGRGIQDIVVTAQRRSERLQNVPIAVTVLTGDALAAKGLSSAIDIATATPGLTYTLVAGAAAPRIRGVGTVTALGGLENSVATYVDGVYYASSVSSVLQLSNIEQIAVLKGPQGTLFGRNATGGLIQVTTLDPKQNFSGRVTGSYGNHDTLGGTLYVTGGLTPALAADLAVFYENQHEGFGHNLLTGADVNRSRNLTIRSKWKLQVGDQTTIKISADHTHLHADGPARRPLYGARPSVGLPYTGGPFDVVSNIQPLFVNDQSGGSINLVHHFGGVDLVSISAYRNAKTRQSFDADSTQFNLIDTNNLFKETQLTQEVQLISTGHGPLTYTLGAYYFRAKGGYDDVRLNLPPIVQNFQTYQRTRSPAVYGQASYKAAERTTLTVGLRYSWETRYFNGAGSILTKATGVTVATTPITGKLVSKRPTWRFSVDQRLNPNVLVYASYNRGFKSGGFNGATFFPAPEAFAPEILDAYEVGLKSDLLDRRVRLNASGFRYNYKNIQLVSAVGGLLKISNAASAKIYGLDLDLTAKPIEQLTLTGGLSIIHSAFGNFPNAQKSTSRPAGGNLVGSGDATGNHLPYTPTWTVNAGADYIVPLASGELQLSGQYFHSNGWYPEADNRLRQRPYDLLNGSATWRSDRAKGVSVSVWGKNITNEVYAVTLQTQAVTDLMVPGAGRTYGATLGYKF